MKTRSIILLIGLMIVAGRIFAESMTDNIGIQTYVNDNAMTVDNKDYLNSRVDNILSRHGFLTSYSNRFFLVIKPAIVADNVVPTEESTQYVRKVEFIFKIGDAIDNIIFATTSLTTAGVGTTDDKAIRNAIGRIKSNQEFENFLNTAKTRIVAYYNARCKVLPNEIENLVNQNKYEQALFELSQIPQSCICYTTALTMAQKVYAYKIQKEDNDNLHNAILSWQTNPNKEGAQMVYSYLLDIVNYDDLSDKIKPLLSDIRAKLQEDELRQWEMDMQRLQLEHEQRMQQEQNSANLTSTLIQSGLEFLSSFNPSSVIQNLLLW